MPLLPYSRVVNIQVTRSDNFVARRGFGTPLFLQSLAVAGQVDATHRTKLYASMEEVAVDFAPTDEGYLAASAIFAQNPRPVAFKVGYYDAALVAAGVDAAAKAAALTAQLNLIREADADWYFLTVESDLRDVATVTDAIAIWAESRTVLAIIDSNDAGTKASGNTTSLAARLKVAGYQRTAVFWHDNPVAYPAVALAARTAAFDLDTDGSAYTAAFKRLNGIPASPITSAELQAITGFVPQLGQSKASGHLASAYVDIGGQNHVQFGSVLSQNDFIDEIHVGDWLKARAEEELFNLLLINDRIAFDDNGMATLASGIETVMNRAIAAGLIASDYDPETGEYSPAYRLTIPRATSVSASQRNARISPPIEVAFRYAGAVHYAQANINMAA